MRNIYLDNAAATPIDPRVMATMEKAARFYANPSSFNNAGRAARAEIDKSRLRVARFLNARANEIVFTGSGSEANNLGILGTLFSFKSGTVLTTAIEHLSVLEPLKRLGLSIRNISINKTGIVDISALETMLTVDCRMISVSYANNEIGTIEPISQIAKIIHNYNKKNNSRMLFHIDACQAAGFLNMDVQHLGVDLLTFDGCKIYGPHGIGVLYVRKETPIRSLIAGAGQEHGLRAGTENTQAIIGLAHAISLIKPAQSNRMILLRDYAIERFLRIPEVILNGPMDSGRLPNNVNIAVEGLSSENLLLELDKYGISAGSGSACTSRSVEPSRVLKAIGVPDTHIKGVVRFSLGRETTKKDIDYTAQTLKKIIPILRARNNR